MEWTASGAEAAHRHLGRVFRIASDAAASEEPSQEGDEVLLRDMHKAIDEVTKGVESFGFNAASARLYAFTHTLTAPTKPLSDCESCSYTELSCTPRARPKSPCRKRWTRPRLKRRRWLIMLWSRRSRVPPPRR